MISYDNNVLPFLFPANINESSASSKVDVAPPLIEGIIAQGILSILEYCATHLANSRLETSRCW